VELDLDLVVEGELVRVEDRDALVLVLGRVARFVGRVVGRVVELLLVVDLGVARVVVLLGVVDRVFGREVVLLRVADRVLARVTAAVREVALKTLRLLKLEFLYLASLRPLTYE
tara:strand:+ start:1696 stop:2037 length:342 start_codon:yes stop_codon:yes gene_type:complete